MQELYLIDGMSLVFRAYHALQKSGLKSKDGEPTFAVFAFANVLSSLLEKKQPDFIAVAFDRAEPTFRHKMFPDYKANRDAFPDDLIPQLKRIKELIKLFGIKIIEAPGYEADDIIGTLSKSAAEAGFFVNCMTNDKDYYQLVQQNVRLLKPSKKSDEEFDIVDIPAVYDKFGVEPEKVIDVLALIGDTADNIPGVKGIGEKTAIPLIQKYGSVEGVYNNLEKIERDLIKKKLNDGRNDATVAKQLVTIKLDVELSYTPENLTIAEPDYPALDKFFADLGFVQLRKHWAEKVPGGVNIQEEAEESLDKFENIETDYKLIENFEQLKDLVKYLKRFELIALDTETDSLDRMSCELVGISVAAEEGRAFYIAVYENKEEYKPVTTLFDNAKDESLYFQEKLPVLEVLDILKPVLENENIKKTGQNIKFDATILKRYGVTVNPIAFDTMLASYILNPDTPHNLDCLSEKWLNYTPIPITKLIGEKKATQKSMKEIDPKDIKDYAAEDADLALKLTHKLKNALDSQHLYQLAASVEFPLIEVLMNMEMNGVRIDVGGLKLISEKIDVATQKLKGLIFREAGESFNIDSPKQLGEILFEKMMIPPIKKTKTGYGTDVQILTQLAAIYPIAGFLLEYRQLAKLNSTYLEALPKLINETTGRIHTNFNQTGAGTGRLSSNDPNLQNIPIRSDLGKEVRKAFIPSSEDYLIMSADYSQIELRIMAYYSGDERLINDFINGADIHSSTAAYLFDIDVNKVDADKRRIAKTVNFGIMYGLGAFGLAQRLSISRTESAEIIKNYFSKYPGIKKYMDDTIALTEKNGYAETLCGRRKYFPDINNHNKTIKSAAERAAINMPIQGTAADMIKLAMIKVFSEMKKNHLQTKLILQVHDELVFEVFKPELEIVTNIVKTQMTTALSLGRVPVEIGIGYGKNWFDAH